MVFVTPVVEHWLDREIEQWSNMKDQCKETSHHKQMFLPQVKLIDERKTNSNLDFIPS